MPWVVGLRNLFELSNPFNGGAGAPSAMGKRNTLAMGMGVARRYHITPFQGFVGFAGIALKGNVINFRFLVF